MIIGIIFAIAVACFIFFHKKDKPQPTPTPTYPPPTPTPTVYVGQMVFLCHTDGCTCGQTIPTELHWSGEFGTGTVLFVDAGLTELWANPTTYHLIRNMNDSSEYYLEFKEGYYIVGNASGITC